MSAFRRSLGSRLQLSFDVYQNKALDDLDAITPKSVVDTFSDTKRKKRACIGDMRVEKIRSLLETGFGVTRSKMQISFHVRNQCVTVYIVFYHRLTSTPPLFLLP